MVRHSLDLFEELFAARKIFRRANVEESSMLQEMHKTPEDQKRTHSQETHTGVI